MICQIVKNMKSLIVSAFLFFATQLFAQDCDCATQFSYVVTYFENNNPAFQKIKTDWKEHQVYLAGLKKLLKEVKQETDIDRCILYLDSYVSLLKDHHSGIGFNLERKDLGTAELIDQFKRSAAYKKFEKLLIDSSQVVSLLMTKQAEDIEGVYSDGRNTVFGIIRKENAPGKYIGVVLKQNKLLDIGHVLMELTKKQNNSYDIVYNIGLLGFNFQKIFKRLDIENGQISSFGFFKTLKATSGGKPYEFKVLDSSTNYLRLGSFDGSLTEELDVFYDSIGRHIKNKPFLIVDLRNNGGGSERSYLKLLQYAYTKPLQIDPAEVWVSAENIKRYEEAKRGDNKDLIERMKKARLSSFIPQSTETNTT
jgi:Peptidase family S41